MKQKLFLAVLGVSLALTGCATSSTLLVTATERDPVQIDGEYPPALAEISFNSYGDRINGILVAITIETNLG